MDTTRNSTAWWLVGGAVAVLLVIWAFVHYGGNNGAGIPNTGVDDSATSTDMNNSYLNATSTTNPTVLNAKG